jgi:hypothetical protein
MADLTDKAFQAAKARGEARLRGPRAQQVHYDAGRNRLVIRLTTGIELGLIPRDVEGLRDASIDDPKSAEIDEFGLGIHFPRLDADLYVPALLQGVLGSRRWTAAQPGAAGGHAGTHANADAAQANSKRAGHSRKRPAAAE